MFLYDYTSSCAVIEDGQRDVIIECWTERNKRKTCFNKQTKKKKKKKKTTKKFRESSLKNISAKINYLFDVEFSNLGCR